MGLPRTQRLAINREVDLQGLPLEPQEYFVFSRIEGRPTVAEIIGSSGLGAEVTEAILEKLLTLEAILTVDAVVVTPTPLHKTRPRVSTQELRNQAQERRKRMLRQQLAGRSRSPTPRVAENALPPEPPPSAAVEPALQPPVIEPVAADDPRLEPSLVLGVLEQRTFLALEDRLSALTPFELLGIQPTHDIKEIRSAFREASRRFHPDAYHGRDLGRFRELLSSLFARAKAAHAELQDPEVRNPLVEAHEAELAEARRIAQQREAARLAAEALRRKQEQAAAEAEAARRREARTAQRAQWKRERLAADMQRQIEHYVREAEHSEAAGKLAPAANYLRLALQLEPSNEALRARWAEVRLLARQRRAKDAFHRACNHVDLGHLVEAVPLFLEAAEADPTAKHLAHAADAVREQDPGKARDLAMGALRCLGEGQGEAEPLRPKQVGELRLMIGRAFLAAGQAESARQQALLAQKLRPGDPQVRALLNSIKVT